MGIQVLLHINPVFVILYVGWQELPNSNWICKKGYLAVYVTELLKLRLFTIKKKHENAKITFYCFLCSRKNCSHIQDDIKNGRSDGNFDNYEFNYDNDFDNAEPQAQLADLVSIGKYPCKQFSELVNIFSVRISDSIELQDIVKKRAICGRSAITELLLPCAIHSWGSLYPYISSYECCGRVLQDAIVQKRAYIFHTTWVSKFHPLITNNYYY